MLLRQVEGGAAAILRVDLLAVLDVIHVADVELGEMLARLLERLEGIQRLLIVALDLRAECTLLRKIS